MENIKNWWLASGWPWLKSYWWVLLIIPLVALVYLARALSRSRVPAEEVTSEVLKQKLETAAKLRDENAALQERLRKAEQELADKQRRIDEGLAVDVEDLRANPEKLRQLMLNVGPGGRR